MEVKVDKNRNLIIKYKLKKSEMYKMFEGETFQTISIFRKPTIVKGMSNCTKDCRYLIMGDYDNTHKEIVLEDIKLLIEKYNLPPFYLFTTKEEEIMGEKVGNYHIINLALFSYSEVGEIINELRCDEKYKTMNQRSPYKSWILRIGKKGKRHRPKFIGTIGKKNNLDKKISEAHLKLLYKLYKIPKIMYSNTDGSSSIKLQEYQTR